MALVLADRVKESTTTTGTGTVNLAGAETGFQTFVAGIGNSNTTYYTIVDGNTGDFEVGIGTVTDASPDTLSRDTILQSSNSDSAVNFGSGTKSVFCTLPADKAVFEDASGNISIPGTIDGRDVAADGATADAALPKAGGTMTGALTTGSAITLNGAQAGGYPSLNFESGSGSVSYINMGTSTDANEGQIAYSPSTNTMTFKAGDVTSFQANDTGIKLLDDDRLQIGTGDDFDIYHTAYNNKNYLEASNGEVNVGRGAFGSGQCKLVVGRSGGGSAGGSVIELHSHATTGQEQVINAQQSLVDFELQHAGSTKLTINGDGIEATGTIKENGVTLKGRALVMALAFG